MNSLVTILALSLIILMAVTVSLIMAARPQVFIEDENLDRPTETKSL